METNSLKFLKNLLATSTPSGFEQSGQEVIRSYMKKFTDHIKTDVHGNVHGVVNPEAEFRVMLSGHCDEIGLMVMQISEKGFLTMAAIGGIYVPLLQGERITLHTKKGNVPGVIGVKPVHLMDAKERETAVTKVHELWVDIGAKNKQDVERAGVELGTPATINTSLLELKNGLIAARGLDDRIGAFCITEALRLVAKEKLKVAVHAVSSVQEEIGLRGATTAAFGIDPHIGIAVDVGHATDYPLADARQCGEANCGDGPILHCGANFNTKLYEDLRAVAKKAKIKTQIQPIPRGSGTDANAIQLTRSGVAAALISVPNRYMHSPVEVISLKDAEQTAQLIASYLIQLDPKTDFTPTL